MTIMKRTYITPEMKAKSLSTDSFFALSIWDGEDATPGGGSLSKWGDLWEDEDLSTDEEEKRHIYRY